MANAKGRKNGRAAAVKKGAETKSAKWLAALQIVGATVAVVGAITKIIIDWPRPQPALIPSPSEQVAIRYDIRGASFVRSIAGLPFGCDQRPDAFYNRLSNLQYSERDNSVFDANSNEQTILVYMVFLRVDNYSNVPLIDIQISAPQREGVYRLEQIPPGQFAAFLIAAYPIVPGDASSARAGDVGEGVVSAHIGAATWTQPFRFDDARLSNVRIPDCTGNMFLSPPGS